MTTIEFKKASVFKRIVAILIDGFLLLISFFLILSFIVQPILQKTTNYNTLYSQYVDVLVASHLYEDTSSEGVSSCSVITSNYDENLTYYYTTYDNISTYNEYKSSYTSIFEYDEETSSYKVIGSSSDLNNFYKTILSKAITQYQARGEVKALYNPISRYSMIMCVLAFLPSILLVNLLPSMLFKNGETLGYKALSLKVISSNKEVQVSKVQVLLRFTFLVVLELFLGLFTMFLIPLVSFLMILFTKNKTSLNDLMTKTLVIDGTPGAKVRYPQESLMVTYSSNGDSEPSLNKNEETEGD